VDRSSRVVVRCGHSSCRQTIHSVSQLWKEDTVKKALSIVAAFVVFIAMGMSANAQDQPNRALVEELLNQVNMKETLEKTSEMLKQMVVAQIQKFQPPADNPAAQARLTSFMEKVMDLVTNEMSWDKVKDEYIALYAETFTEQELQDIIAFYKTPSGQALIKKQPEVMKRSMQMSQKMMGQLMPRIQAMTNELKENLLTQPPPKTEEK
jgi:uncharacterized protein